MLLLENVRFEPGEERNDPGLARALAAARGRLRRRRLRRGPPRPREHRGGRATCCPRAAGRLLEAEVRHAAEILEHPARPLVAVLGGAKVADKIAVIDRFLELADAILIGRRDVLPVPARRRATRSATRCASRRTSSTRASALERAAGAGQRRASSCPVDLVIATRAGRRRRAPRARRRRRARRLDGSRHRPPHGARATRARSPARARSSGTGRWAPSSSSRSPPARARSPRRSRAARR